MRLALYILAFYTVALSCIPCQDEVLRVSFEGAVAIVSTNADHQEQGIADLCSPFCSCACCAGVTLHEPIPSLPESASVLFSNDNASACTTDSKGGELTSVWQPPRI